MNTSSNSGRPADFIVDLSGTVKDNRANSQSWDWQYQQRHSQSANIVDSTRPSVGRGLTMTDAWMLCMPDWLPLLGKIVASFF